MKGIRFRPEQKGLRAALFDLEADVMQIVWTKGWEQFSVASVHRELEREREIAYTTVMTTVSRLYDKGLLDRTRDGRRYAYRPRMSQEAFMERMTQGLIASLDSLGSERALAMLVKQVDDSDLEELNNLEALIRQRKKELSK